MMTKVTDFKDYKEFLASKIRENAKIRGYQSRLAIAARCHRSYLSQVLTKKRIHLTPDHAAELSHFFEHSPSESEYFLTLLDLARVNSEKLRERLEKKLKLLRAEALGLSENKIDDENAAIALHSSYETTAAFAYLCNQENIALTDLALALKIGPESALSHLRTLSRAGLASFDGKKGIWSKTEKANQIAMDPNQLERSPALRIFHSNFRLKALERFSENDPAQIMLTGFLNLDTEQEKSLRNDLRNLFSKYSKRPTEHKARELRAFALNLDLFRI